MSTTLLSTKLHIPVPPDDFVERPHLIDRLDESIKRRLTLVCAPAGFGKTTVVSQWVQHRSRPPVAWLSLAKEDNELNRFISYLVAALQQADPHVGIITQTLLETQQMIAVEALLTPLINDLNQLDSPIIIVLDDYHVISDQSVHDALTFLIENQPLQLRLVLISRSDPPLPLGRLRARGQLVEIRSIDLSFDRDAIRDFFHDLMGIDLSSDNLALLEARTEGWIAGIQLAGLALQGRGDTSEFITRFAGDHIYIVDYLGAEVFKRQTDAVRNFLLKTSILSHLNPALCNAVTEERNGREILDYLRQANLFLIPLDDNSSWYRYHHLFSDLLLHFLQQTCPEQIPDLHNRASHWYREQGLVSEAIHHALAARDYHRASDLIEQVGLTLVGEGHLKTLHNWILSIPDTFLHERPYLAVLLAWGNVLIGTPGDAIKHLEAAVQGLQHVTPGSATRLEIACQLELLRGYVARSDGDLVTAINQTKKALNYLPEGNVFLQCTVYLNLGGNYWHMGDFAAAEDPLYRAVAFADHAETVYPALAGAGFLANIYLQTGRLRQAKKHCQQTIEVAFSQRSYPLPAIAYIYVEQGELFYEQNDLDAAAETLENAIRFGKNTDRVVNIGRALQLLALVKQTKGEIEAATQYIDDANTHFEESGSRYQIMHRIEFDYYRVRLWLVRGDLISASRWARDYEERRTVNTTWDILNELSFARVLLANRQLDKALNTLNQCITLATESGIMGWVIQSLTLKALCLQVRQDDDNELIPLSQALSLAEPEGYIRTFVGERMAMAQLLTATLTRYDELKQTNHPFSADYASQLLSTVKAENRADSLLIESLSDRETDVLRLLAAELSNQEIADTLVITLGTVKQYNHTIYRKLDVHTRNQAVQRAKELHLL